VYAFSVEERIPFAAAVEAVVDALKGEQFGVVSDIDVQALMRAKLNEETPPYRILGACAPPLAKRVLAADPEAGALLPCTVIVRQISEGLTGVTFMDPGVVLGLARNEALDGVAREAKERLERVRDRLSGSRPVSRL
jgi:uncharacterized protein (DUF302 family)